MSDQRTGYPKSIGLKVANTTDIQYVSASQDDTPSQYLKKTWNRIIFESKSDPSVMLRWPWNSRRTNAPVAHHLGPGEMPVCDTWHWNLYLLYMFYVLPEKDSGGHYTPQGASGINTFLLCVARPLGLKGSPLAIWDWDSNMQKMKTTRRTQVDSWHITPEKKAL